MPVTLPTERDDSAPLDEAIARGLAAVEEATSLVGDSGRPVVCRDVGRVLDTAIEHGAPIWNRGSQIGCAKIYLQAACSLVARIRSPEISSALVSGGVTGAIGALQRVAEAHAAASPDNAERLGWALRSIFDRFHCARGIEDIDLLIDATRAGGGKIDSDLVSLCLSVAISHGNVLYQAQALDACAVLHAHTARRILELLTNAELNGRGLSPGLGRVRRELAPILGSHPRITEENAEAVAWKLFEAFLRILRHAPDDSNRPEAGAYEAFLSYRRAAGSETALAVRAYLQMRGLNIFLDMEGLESGEFGPHLLQAIERAPNFLLILTPGCLDRCQHPEDWLRTEIAHAIRSKRTLIPILKDGFLFPATAALPEDIRALPGYQAVTYSHEYFGAVIDRVERYMRSGIRDADQR